MHLYTKESQGLQGGLSLDLRGMTALLTISSYFSTPPSLQHFPTAILAILAPPQSNPPSFSPGLMRCLHTCAPAPPTADLPRSIPHTADSVAFSKVKLAHCHLGLISFGGFPLLF